MTKVSEIYRLDSGCGPLPVHAYCDQSIYQIEQDLIFAKEPRYVGCDKITQNVGDYFSLQGEGNGRILVRSENGVNLLSNVCRHRQAIMLQGKGNVQNIVCPLHQWTYEKDGRLIGSPFFNSTPCRNLQVFDLQNWNGLLFDANSRSVANSLRSIAPDVMNKIDMSSYVFDRIEFMECKYNWKTFIDFYLEDYHIAPFHPGLSNFVNCSSLEWMLDDWYSVQTVGFKDNFYARAPGDSNVYSAWKTAISEYYGRDLPDCAAMWVYIYPNVMIEWYPMVLVISTITPSGPERTLNQIEFYHPEDIMTFDTHFIDGARAGASAYLETAIEDDEIGMRMQQGREVLKKRSTNDAGPYQSPLEDGMEHFHALYRKQLGEIIL